MTSQTEVNSISKLRQEHDDLYKRVVEEAASLTRRGTVHCVAELAKGGTNGSSTLSPQCAHLKQLLDEVDAFLKHLSNLSANPETVENYLWLCDTAVRWEHVFSSKLNLPKSVPLSQPPVNLLPPLPPGDSLSKEELDTWVEKCAQVVWAYRSKRTRHYESTPEEMKWDWSQAEVFLASDILDGTLNFARRIGASSYWRLEQVGLFEVRQLLAYLDWEQSAGIFDDRSDSDMNYHYLKACAHIREKLLAAHVKASSAEFGEAKRYLEEHYLVGNNKLDYKKLEQSGKYNIIAIKANRIKEMTKCEDEMKNWCAAETYVKMFYENIVPAVMTDKPNNIEAVLKAFHFSLSSEHSYHIINSFEMALAVYFLKADTIAKLCPF
jgi:hypothetical protein